MLCDGGGGVFWGIGEGALVVTAEGDFNVKVIL